MMVEVKFLRYENLAKLKYFNGKAWPNRAGEITKFVEYSY